MYPHQALFSPRIAKVLHAAFLFNDRNWKKKKDKKLYNLRQRKKKERKKERERKRERERRERGWGKERDRREQTRSYIHICKSLCCKNINTYSPIIFCFCFLNFSFLLDLVFRIVYPYSPLSLFLSIFVWLDGCFISE